VRATSTDGIVYTAAFSDSWYNDCTAKITLKDGRVFLEAVTVRYDPNARYGMDFIGELFQ
jgi:hypothetical protein